MRPYWWLGNVVVYHADAQGTLQFVNRSGSVFRAPVYRVDTCLCQKTGNDTNGLPVGTQTYAGPLAMGTGFTMQLWVGPTNAADWELRPVVQAPFGYNANSGYITARNVTLTDFPPGSYVKCQARAWDNLSVTINSWAEATCAGRAHGTSDSFIVGPLGGTEMNGTFHDTPLTINLRSFCLIPDIYSDGMLRTTILRNVASNPAVSMSANYLLTGDNVTLTATGAAAQSSTTRFQWQLDGADIADATNASFNLGAAQSADSGRYRVQATGPDCPGEFGFDLWVLPPPSLLNVRFDPMGFFKATAIAAPFRTVFFETSTNLHAWSLVSSQALTLTTTCSFNHYFAPPRSPRFLRTRVSP